LGVGGRKRNKSKEKAKKRPKEKVLMLRAYTHKENPTHFKEVDGEMFV
jgi:hypothetical protein